VRVEMEATYTKDTPKKLRFNSEKGGISISIYIGKNDPIPDELLIKLKKEK